MLERLRAREEPHRGANHCVVGRFLPDNTLGNDDYDYALVARDRVVRFDDFAGLVAHACDDSRARASLSMRVASDSSAEGSIHFLADGGLVLGLRVTDDAAMTSLTKLVATVGCGWGYVSGSADPQPPEAKFCAHCDALNRRVSITSR